MFGSTVWCLVPIQPATNLTAMVLEALTGDQNLLTVVGRMGHLLCGLVFLHAKGLVTAISAAPATLPLPCLGSLSS